MHEPPDQRIAPVRGGTLLKWVEPEVRMLDVRETAQFPHVGSDGGVVAPDCTRS
jgi:hypothetical protein